MLAVCGSRASTRRAHHPRATPTIPAQTKHHRLQLDEDQHLASLPAQRTQDADFPGALKNRHSHGVRDAQNTDQQGN